MLDYETQTEPHKEMVSPTKSLEIAIHMEMGAQNNQNTNQKLNRNTQSVNLANSIQNFNRTTNYQHQRQVNNRNANIPYVRITNLLAFKQIIVSIGLRSTVKPAPQKGRIVTIVEL